MIAILVAVRQELRPILRRAQSRQVVRQAHLDFHEGTLAGQPVALLALVIQTRLTARQREIVNLYFYAGKTQSQIAEILGISQQVVSKQLFGATRKGKRVGGAIRKLEKLLRANGISFE